MLSLQQNYIKKKNFNQNFLFSLSHVRTHTHTGEDHHVHFDDFESDHENPVIQKGPGGKIHIHLGFLQVKHRYRIELNIQQEILASYCHENSKLVLKVDEENTVPNIHCKLLSFKGKATEQSQFYEAEFEFFAHKEKLLKEEIKLLTSDEKVVKLMFHARVLGRGKGTPMLKNGIHLLGIEDDEESGKKIFSNKKGKFFILNPFSVLL